MKNILREILPRRFISAAPIHLIIGCPEHREIDDEVGSKLHHVVTA